MDLSDIAALYRHRQSCRAFDEREVPEALIKSICELALLAPSACNAQPWKLIALFGETRARAVKCVQELGMNRFASDAGALVAVCSAGGNFTAKLGSRLKDTDFTANDLGILTAHLVLAADAAGLGSCILGWRNEKKLRALLGLDEKTRIPVVVALGYAREDCPIRPKKRKPYDETYRALH